MVQLHANTGTLSKAPRARRSSSSTCIPTPVRPGARSLVRRARLTRPLLPLSNGAATNIVAKHIVATTDTFSPVRAMCNSSTVRSIGSPDVSLLLWTLIYAARRSRQTLGSSAGTVCSSRPRRGCFSCSFQVWASESGGLATMVVFDIACIGFPIPTAHVLLVLRCDSGPRP